jgi:CBS domain-containing protein
MSRIADIMSTDVRTIQPQESLRRAAQCMQELDVGALPVHDGERLLGMLTDRDIVIRGIAGGLNPDQSCVSDIMTAQVEYCTTEQDGDEVKAMMGARQVRRLPVLDGHRRLVGIVSLGDLAVRETGHIDRAVREISQPAGAAH